MADIVLVSDAPSLLAELRAVFDARDHTVREVTTGEGVVIAAQDRLPDLVISDFQVGNMGGMAICLDLRLEESGGRVGRVPVLLLLDRRPDVFLARRAGADGWLVKPLDPIRLRKAAAALLSGGTYHDESFKPAESAPPSVDPDTPPNAEGAKEAVG